MQLLIPRPPFPSFSLALSGYGQDVAQEHRPAATNENTDREPTTSSESSSSQNPERFPDLMKTFDSRCPDYWLEHPEDKTDADTVFEEREEKESRAIASGSKTSAETRPTARNGNGKRRWMKLVRNSHLSLFKHLRHSASSSNASHPVSFWS
ncbi:hypothetical protein CVT24_007900 [Panaeolus cyanescens]|uniref:Uncharacterized protein n=1 Tax=Panaeolus cyanescens TaxID=181874 RepID=A0A409VZP7_9AGAR|nr:hypothetical protein CVT24_007900 [Panaeolus cyanescens]